MNYVVDLGPMLMSVKVNVVPSSTSSLSSGISQLHAQARAACHPSELLTSF